MIITSVFFFIKTVISVLRRNAKYVIRKWVFVMKLTYKADEDKVIEQTADNIVPYESLGVTTPEEAEEVLAELISDY